MANFEGHATAGAIAATLVWVGVFAWVSTSFPLKVAFPVAMAAFIATFVGAVIVDADMPGTIPFRIVVTILEVVVLVAIVGFILTYPGTVLGLLEYGQSWVPPEYPAPLVLGALAGVSIIVLLAGIGPLLHWLTGSHRTRTHNLTYVAGVCLLGAAGLFVVLGDAGITDPLRIHLSAAAPFGFFAGAFVHIELLD